MTPQAIVDLLLSLLPAVASVAPSVYAALFGTATVESMTARAREALAKAGSTRAAMEDIFAAHPAMVAVVKDAPQVSAHMSDRLRALSLSSSLTAEDRDVLAKSAVLIASAVAHDAKPRRDIGEIPAYLLLPIGKQRQVAESIPFDRQVAPVCGVCGHEKESVRLSGRGAWACVNPACKPVVHELPPGASLEPPAGLWGEPGEGD